MASGHRRNSEFDGASGKATATSVVSLSASTSGLRNGTIVAYQSPRRADGATSALDGVRRARWSSLRVQRNVTMVESAEWLWILLEKEPVQSVAPRRVAEATIRFPADPPVAATINSVGRGQAQHRRVPNDERSRALLATQIGDLAPDRQRRLPRSTARPAGTVRQLRRLPAAAGPPALLDRSQRGAHGRGDVKRMLARTKAGQHSLSTRGVGVRQPFLCRLFASGEQFEAWQHQLLCPGGSDILLKTHS